MTLRYDVRCKQTLFCERAPRHCAVCVCVCVCVCDTDIGVFHFQNASFSCSCPAGYTGSLCESAIDYCVNLPCHNGTCRSDAASQNYTCDCSAGRPWCHFSCTAHLYRSVSFVLPTMPHPSWLYRYVIVSVPLYRVHTGMSL